MKLLQAPLTPHLILNLFFILISFLKQRLSTQISKQCQAFFAGLSEMIDPRWLRMLNREELRFLVAGTEEPIDIDDLRANTVYGGYHEKDASVEYFWEALRVSRVNVESPTSLLFVC